MSFRNVFKRVKDRKETSGAETGAVAANTERKHPQAPKKRSVAHRQGLTFLKEDAIDHDR
jgi:hypothetical protein